MNRLYDFFKLEKLKEKIFLIGDLHNHCDISYGHGGIEDAVTFASQQLDFFSVTGHYCWPDIANDKFITIPGEVVEYHRQGFSRLRDNWEHYKEVLKRAMEQGKTVFPSYEYHSFRMGDYTIVKYDIESDLPPETDDQTEMKNLENLLSKVDESTIAFPHHIGYKTGYRGINWSFYNDKVCPLIEIISMHGCSESMDSPMPYLHTMGPRCSSNTMRSGLEQGFRFSVIANTDHHNASPGSFGFGRTGLWSTSRDKETIWRNLKAGNTVALSGDPIELYLERNGKNLESYVAGFDRFRYVQLVCDGKVVGSYPGSKPVGKRYCVPFSFGWGKKGRHCQWEVTIKIRGSEVHNIVPRLRGEDIVAPLDRPDEYVGKPTFSRTNDGAILSFTTIGNVNTTTDATQGVVVELDLLPETALEVYILATWNDRSLTLKKTCYSNELIESEQVDYLDGFVSPAMQIGKAVNSMEATCHFSFDPGDNGIEYAYLRALQENGCFAVSSPVFLR